ncbi:DUF4129 domain-containing protein, partial [Halorussus sp. GCM10023401]
AAADAPAESEHVPDESYLTVRDAWERFLGRTSVRDPSAKTPGELAAHAIEEDGLPPKPVRTLRDVFRDVEYGARDPTERLPYVERAVDTLDPDGASDVDGVDSAGGSRPDAGGDD